MLHSYTGTSPGLPFPNPAVTCLLTTPAKCHREPGAEPSPGSRACLRSSLAGGREGRDGAGVPLLCRGHAGMRGIRGGGFCCVSAVPRPSASLLGSVRLLGVSARLRCLRSQVLPQGGGARARGAAGGGEGMGFPRLISDPASLARCPWGPVAGAAREPGAAAADAPGPGPARPPLPARLSPWQG